MLTFCHSNIHFSRIFYNNPVEWVILHLFVVSFNWLNELIENSAVVSDVPFCLCACLQFYHFMLLLLLCMLLWASSLSSIYMGIYHRALPTNNSNNNAREQNLNAMRFVACYALDKVHIKWNIAYQQIDRTVCSIAL